MRITKSWLSGRYKDYTIRKSSGGLYFIYYKIIAADENVFSTQNKAIAYMKANYR